MPDYTVERVDVNTSAYSASKAGSTYTFDDGLLLIPVMGPPASLPVIARVHAGHTIRNSSFAYQKSGVPPIIPPPFTTKNGSKFLSGSIDLPAPSVSTDGTLIYTISGQYMYAYQNHFPQDGTLFYDAYPFITGIDSLTVEQNYYPDSSDPAHGYYYNYLGQKFDLNVFGSYRILV